MEEAMSVVVGLTSSHAVWSTLRTTFIHPLRMDDLDKIQYWYLCAQLSPLFLLLSDWYTDTRATVHMTNDSAQLDKSDTYSTGKGRVIVGNGAFLPISLTGTISPTSSLTLKDVLVVPGLTRNLISIGKLTSDFPFSITFTNDCFIIQNQVTRRVVATGQLENGFYALKRGHQSLILFFLV
jgi:hypothetical protein